MSDEPLRFTVTAADADRLDRVIARRFPAASRRRVMALIDDGGVKIGGRRGKKGARVAAGAESTVLRPPADVAVLRGEQVIAALGEQPATTGVRNLLVLVNGLRERLHIRSIQRIAHLAVPCIQQVVGGGIMHVHVMV